MSNIFKEQANVQVIVYNTGLLKKYVRKKTKKDFFNTKNMQ